MLGLVACDDGGSEPVDLGTPSADMDTRPDMDTTTDMSTPEDLGLVHDGSIADMTIAILDGGTVLTCTDVCTASMACDADGGGGGGPDCSVICPLFESLSASAGCHTELVSLIECFGYAASVCGGGESPDGGASCEQTALQPLAMCFNTYCMDHSSEQDCIDASGLFGGGGETDGGVPTDDGGVPTDDGGFPDVDGGFPDFDGGFPDFDGGPPA